MNARHMKAGLIASARKEGTNKYNTASNSSAVRGSDPQQSVTAIVKVIKQRREAVSRDAW